MAIDAPTWVTMWYPADPHGLKLAVERFRSPVTTARERAANKAYDPSAATFGCSSCGRFAFAQPTLCFYCRRDP